MASDSGDLTFALPYTEGAETRRTRVWNPAYLFGAAPGGVLRCCWGWSLRRGTWAPARQDREGRNTMPHIRARVLWGTFYITRHLDGKPLCIELNVRGCCVSRVFPSCCGRCINYPRSYQPSRLYLVMRISLPTSQLRRNLVDCALYSSRGLLPVCCYTISAIYCQSLNWISSASTNQSTASVTYSAFVDDDRYLCDTALSYPESTPKQ